MIIDYLDLTGISSLPSEDHSPLIVDPNGIKALPFAFQRL
jgi:hypothetical protein